MVRQLRRIVAELFSGSSRDAVLELEMSRRICLTACLTLEASGECKPMGSINGGKEESH
jgi:hypothetical protein